MLSRWEGWRFARGEAAHGRQARARLFRIRRNLLNPAETDFDRTRRQQQVVAATLDKVTSFGTALRLPFRGKRLVEPLATDLGAWELMQLGWVYFRADTGRACRLGGDPAAVGGESVILGTEDNVSTVAMFTGRSAPLPPPRGLPYAPAAASAIAGREPVSRTSWRRALRVGRRRGRVLLPRAVGGRRPCVVLAGGLPRAAPVVGRVEARAA